MVEQGFREWLVQKSWAQGVYYSKAVAWLLPPAALAADAPYFNTSAQHWPPGFAGLLAWQLAAELFSIAVALADRLLPRLRDSEAALNAACAGAMLLATWVGAVHGWMWGDLAIYAAGATFVATVMCTPRRVRRPMYVLSFLVLGLAAGLRGHEGVELLSALVNPFCVVVLCMELDSFMYARNAELFAEMRRAESERARADKVLYNVLPASIADELKREDKVNAVKFDNMGVLFADIAGFTSFSRALPPDALVLVLNQIFSAFDGLVEKYGLEKIKTIGDAYMVVAHHRLDALGQLALDMREALRRYNSGNGTELALRIGMHAGPAVAGVIGVKRFLYDVWGDTVNVASRMEASGEPGAVHVSEAVYLQTRQHFAFAARGPIDVKGRGRMSTYWLLDRAAVAAAPQRPSWPAAAPPPGGRSGRAP